jgi:hypothetical protein
VIAIECLPLQRGCLSIENIVVVDLDAKLFLRQDRPWLILALE